MRLSFTPTLDKEEAGRRLDRLLVAGSILDAEAADRIGRIARAFQSYASCYPLPLWAPGLVIDNEMRGLTETLFPISQVRAVFDLVLRRGCRFSPLLAGSYLHNCSNWLDLLQKMRPQVVQADPSVLLRELALDQEKRTAFLFALFLPRHFGGGFDRYPLQSQWLEFWLRENRGRLGGRIRALDSACGSGEGTYQLAGQISTAGFDRTGSLVHGSTLEPVELFAGAHAFFPQDPEREREYRRRIASLLDSTVQMEFYLDEVCRPAQSKPYDLVLCNGLLGGPLLHEAGELSGAIAALAARLAPGGVLLAADQFHAGWRLRVPVEKLTAMMQEQGLVPLEVPEGIAGRRAE